MRLMCLGLGQPEGAASLPAEHGRILEALSARDPAAAERAVREHLEAGKRRTFERAAGGKSSGQAAGHSRMS